MFCYGFALLCALNDYVVLELGKAEHNVSDELDCRRVINYSHVQNIDDYTTNIKKQVAAFLADIEERLISAPSSVITTEKLHESFANWLDSTRNRKTSMTKNKLTSEIKRLTGLETFQITAGEFRGRRAFDFSEYIEKRKKEIPEQERRAEWEKIENEMKENPQNDEVVQEVYDWAAENFVKSRNINDFLACLRKELEKAKDTHDEIELCRFRDISRILEHIESRSAA